MNCPAETIRAVFEAAGMEVPGRLPTVGSRLVRAAVAVQKKRGILSLRKNASWLHQINLKGKTRQPLH